MLRAFFTAPHERDVDRPLLPARSRMSRAGTLERPNSSAPAAGAWTWKISRPSNARTDRKAGAPARRKTPKPMPAFVLIIGRTPVEPETLTWKAQNIVAAFHSSCNTPAADPIDTPDDFPPRIWATEDESSNKTPCGGRFLKGLAMGLDLGLGVVILIAAFRGWFQGFVSQTVRLGVLVASVYAAVRCVITPSLTSSLISRRSSPTWSTGCCGGSRRWCACSPSSAWPCWSSR